MNRRVWTEEEKAIVRRDYLKRDAREIAEELGRDIRHVYSFANRDGLFGADRHTVSDKRRELGLPAHSGVKGSKYTPHLRRKISEGVQRQCQRLGIDRVTDLRTMAFRRFAAGSGWPEDLRPRAVQILNLLAASGVPLTRREIADGIGMAWKGSRKSLVSNDPEGSYLAHLVKRKLVLCIQRAHQVTGKGRGRSCHKYTLGPEALRILEERCKTEN